VQRRLHLLELLHHRRRMALQAAPPVGKAELVVGAGKQRPAQLRFQCSNALAQRLPGQKQPLCRPGIIQLLTEGQKIIQLPDVHEFLPCSILNTFTAYRLPAGL